MKRRRVLSLYPIMMQLQCGQSLWISSLRELYTSSLNFFYTLPQNSALQHMWMEVRPRKLYPEGKFANCWHPGVGCNCWQATHLDRIFLIATLTPAVQYLWITWLQPQYPTLWCMCWRMRSQMWRSFVSMTRCLDSLCMTALLSHPPTPKTPSLSTGLSLFIRLFSLKHFLSPGYRTLQKCFFLTKVYDL